MEVDDKSLHIFDQKPTCILLRVCSHIFSRNYFEPSRLGSHNQSRLLGKKKEKDSRED